MCIHSRKNPVTVGWSGGGWATRDGKSQLGYMVGVADIEILQGKGSPVTIISWHSSKTPRVAKSSSAVELQATGEVDDEMTYVRLVLYEIWSAPSKSDDGRHTQGSYRQQWSPAAVYTMR